MLQKKNSVQQASKRCSKYYLLYKFFNALNNVFVEFDGFHGSFGDLIHFGFRYRRLEVI